jgi:C-terminal processing protease CtpA/Prc
MKRYFLKSVIAGILPVFFVLTACREDDPEPVSQVQEVKNEVNNHVDSWIYDNMKYWYLWNDELPASTDKKLDPEAYFKSLLSPDDRFSWIQDNYKDLLNSLQGVAKETGYEFVLYREKEGSDNVVMQITYVKPASPAETAGLKRGDLVTQINGTTLTVNNYQDLLGDIHQNHTVQYKPILTDQQRFGEPATLSLSAVEYSEDPNYLHKVMDIGGKKIGYFVYNFFAGGTDDKPGKYDAETDAVFADFKSQGITDLVLDLRFNSGGSESSAKNLASLIGRGVNQTSIFLKREYNPEVQQDILNDETLGEDFLTSYYQNEPNNIGDQLASGRVYILTSSRTASASELIINALKPYMEVFLIGDRTYGKNVGSISIYDEKDPGNLWGMQPIVVKVYNSLDQSDYSDGFQPDVVHPDNNLFVYPLGDPREALLGLAIGQITGSASTARQGVPSRKQLATSLDFKRRSFNLNMDQGEPGLIRK